VFLGLFGVFVGHLLSVYWAIVRECVFRSLSYYEASPCKCKETMKETLTDVKRR